LLYSDKSANNFLLLHFDIQNKTVDYTVLFVFGARAPSGPGPPHSRSFKITYNEAPHSVGLLWTSDQLVAEASTWQHTTLTTERHPCPQLDSNPQSQQASGRRPYALDRAATW